MLALSLQAATVARMACGGAGGTDQTENVWAADTKTGGGAAWTSANQSALSTQPVPYQTLCYSAGAVPFSRTFAVPAGNYNVILKFLEPNKTAAGQRTFSVSINGAPVLIGLDVFAGAGAALRPYDRTFPVSAPGGFIQITAAGVLGNAVLSAVQIDSVPIVDDGSKITCESDTITVGAELNADGPAQEVTILTDVPGTWRWEQITICPTTRFTGQAGVFASIGRPGTNNDELTGAKIPMLDSSNNSNCWTARPSPPQLSGSYDVVVNFTVYTDNGQTAGNIKNLTAGTATWEACGYPGKIGNVAQVAKPASGKVMQCSGSYSHTNPITGHVETQNCDGMLWAQFAGIDMIGIPGAPAADEGSWAIWKRIR